MDNRRVVGTLMFSFAIIYNGKNKNKTYVMGLLYLDKFVVLFIAFKARILPKQCEKNLMLLSLSST